MLKELDTSNLIFHSRSFFCILSADQLELEVKPENTSKLKAGLKITMQLMQISEFNITLSHIKSVDLVEIYDKPSHTSYLQNVVFGDSNIDRSMWNWYFS